MTTDPKTRAPFQLMGEDIDIERTAKEISSYSADPTVLKGNEGPEPSAGWRTYDAGYLSDYGGGNVEWWQDYIRDELGRAHDFYTEQFADRTLAASPPRSEVPSVWRDISSAPKDGKPILLGHSQAVFDGYWDDAVAGWVRGDRDSYDELITYPATHWQPLPAIPDAGSGGIAATEPQALYEPIPSDEIRERVARIIDPVAWENRETHLRIANGPHTILARTTARRNADASVESSFAKADQILALYTTPGDTNG